MEAKILMPAASENAMDDKKYTNCLDASESYVYLFFKQRNKFFRYAFDLYAKS